MYLILPNPALPFFSFEEHLTSPQRHSLQPGLMDAEHL